MTRLPKIGFIENAGPNTLESFLKTTGDKARRLDLAVAFLTASGLDSVLYLLKKVARRGKVRLLTGLYQGFTEAPALRKLLRVQVETQGRISVAISRNDRFHWKCYIASRTKSADLVIGSSNLTSEGLKTSGELNVVLTVDNETKPYRDLTKTFQKHWESRAVLLSDSILKKYEQWKSESHFELSRTTVPIRKILGSSTANRLKSEMLPSNFWRTSLVGELEEETVAVLEDTTDWDRKYHAYFSTWETKFGIGDKVIIFDLVANVVSVAEIKDTTETPKKTPDGVHFAAYNQVAKIRTRRLLPNRWRSMKSSGLLRVQGDANATRKLTSKQFGRFVENLKQTAK